MCETPSVEIMEQLQDNGAIVDYSDPYVPVFPKMRRYSFNLNSVELTSDSVQSYDCVVVATNHDDFDYSMLVKHARLIVDTRGVFRTENEKVIHA